MFMSSMELFATKGFSPNNKDGYIKYNYDNKKTRKNLEMLQYNKAAIRKMKLIMTVEKRNIEWWTSWYQDVEVEGWESLDVNCSD